MVCKLIELQLSPTNVTALQSELARCTLACLAMAQKLSKAPLPPLGAAAAAAATVALTSNLALGHPAWA